MENKTEEFNGRRKHKHGGGRRYRHRYPRNRWWGRNRSVYTTPVYTAPVIYGGWYNPNWYNPNWYNSNWYNPWYYWTGPCKNGCTNLGKGEWGCQYPGNQYNDCLFASDCRGCDNKINVKRVNHGGWWW